MTEIIINKDPNSQKFEYTYSSKQQKEIESIRNKYLPKQEDKMEVLRRLDKSAEKPGTMVAIVLGTIGTLMFGIGMCCTMVWSSFAFLLGIAIGLIGIVLIISAYPLYKKVTLKQREKITPQILALSQELSGVSKSPIFNALG